MTQTERETNERAARKAAKRLDVDPSTIRYCIVCGRTIVYSENRFNPPETKEAGLYCTCEDNGPPMTRLE